jgi:4-carboxymuconolactone decarboxylase
MAKRVLPKDVYEDSRNRLPLPKREDLDDAGRKVFDHHTDPKGGSIAGLQGPGGIKLHSPKLAAAAAPATRYLRREAGFSGPIRELIILMAAREMESKFEWAAHEPEALKEGLPQAVIDVVKHRKPTDGLPETEATVITFGRQLFRDKKVEPAVFAKARQIFGERQLVDMVALMGNYASTALMLAAFDMQLPDGDVKELPAS